MSHSIERIKSMANLMNLCGQVFGDLTVTSLSERKHKPKGRAKPKRLWNCKCSCGTKIVVRHDYLLHTHNPKTHCGCKNRGLPTQYSQEYHIHNSMIRRCYNPTHVGYAAYGGRGIRVCDEWQGPTGFETFLKEVGPRPSSDHSIDRVDPNGNYQRIHPTTGKVQVQWATTKHQSRNKRNSIFLPHPQTGVPTPAAEVAEYLGVRYQVMRQQYMARGEWPGQKPLEQEPGLN